MLTVADIRRDQVWRGTVWPKASALDALMEATGLDVAGVAPADVAVLLLVSYLAGMEVPGRQCTLGTVRARFSSDDIVAPLAYELRVLDVDEAFGLVSTLLTIGASPPIVARVEVAAFVRPEPPEVTAAAMAARLPPSADLAGSAAVVFGGSRGLGAALTFGLASQGCPVVVAYRHSEAEAQALLRQGSGSIEVVRGDARDPSWCEELAAGLVAQGRGPDIVVCNAWEPPLAMDLGVSTVGELLAAVTSGLATVAAPLAALLPAVAARRGVVVVISSTAVSKPPPEWPHYVTAKAAVEGLAHWAVAAWPEVGCLVVRAPKMLTDLTSTPTGRIGARPVESVAAAILGRLVQGVPPGEIAVFDP